MKASSLSCAMFDSLPYVEIIHEDYEEYALALIEEEMNANAIVPQPTIKMAPINFRTPTMQLEYETLVVNGSGNGASESSFQNRPKEQLQLFQPTKVSRPKSTEEWKNNEKGSANALSWMKSRFEAERIRGLVLQVEKEEGVATWKDYNTSQDELAGFWTKLLKKEVETVEEINFRRQQTQKKQVGPEIDRLNEEYQQVLYRRNQLEHAIEGMRRKAGINSKNEESRKRKLDKSNV